MRTVSVSAVRIQLASFIAVRDVHQRQVPDAGHLHVVRGLHKVRPRDRTVGDETRPVPWLDAPRHLDALRVANDRVRSRLRGREDAEVVDRVDCTRSSSQTDFAS